MMCLNPEDWPNSAGKIDQGAGRVFLVVSDQRFPIEDFNTGYCVGGCPIYVEPREEIIGFIAYKDFNLPQALADKPKRLEFSPKAFPCARKMRSGEHP
jgi:hypothetical protein